MFNSIYLKTKLCGLMCAVANCDVNDGCWGDCLYSLVIVCIVCLLIRRERCRIYRGRRVCWIWRTRARSLCQARQAILWACTTNICIYFHNMFTLKARFTKPISKIYGYYFATLCRSLYKTLGWENNVVYSKLLWNVLWVYGTTRCRCCVGKVEKWWCLWKMHSVLVLWKPILPCATTFTTYGKRRSHVVCSY